MKRLLALVVLLAGVYVGAAHAAIVSALPFTLQNGTTADATQVMADFNAIVSDVNANAAKNGVNSDITSILGLTTALSYTQGGTSVWIGGTSTGSANAQVVATVTPTTSFSLVAGKRVLFIAGYTNTAATTLNTASTGAKNVYKMGPSGPVALSGGEIVAGALVEAAYDGTQYQLITNNMAVVGPLTPLASATTTDLGTIPSHNVSITGTTTITGFGSTATTDYPVYYIAFTGALTLTYNGTSLILPSSADIVTVAGDTAVAEYLGSGNWRIRAYNRLGGTSVSGAQGSVAYIGASGVPALLAPGTSGQFLKTQGASANPTWGTASFTDYQAFTSSGTWTKPVVTSSSMTTVQCWGAGGGGGASNRRGGGGGGSFVQWTKLTSALGSTETVTIGSGGATNAAGGSTTFGSWLTAYGGGAGGTSSGASAPGGGGGGGGLLSVGGDGQDSTSGAAGGTAGSLYGAAGGAGGQTGAGIGPSNGGVGSTGTGSPAGEGGAGGGGGGADSAPGGVGGAGGSTAWAGAGGGGTGNATHGAGGTSLFGGGNGGGNGVAGTAPGGGGGGGASGARGECRVFTTG